MPGIPPLRISNTEDTFNQIPVFEIEASGATLTKLSPTKVQLSFAGTVGPSGPSGATIVYAPTGGPYISFATNNTLIDEHVLTASDNIVITTNSTTVWVSATTSDISGKQDSLTIPIIVTSGGTGLSVAGSATSMIGMNSAGVVYDYYSLVASNNMIINRVGTTYNFEATTGIGASSVVYAPTGGFYVVGQTNLTLSNELLITASDSIVITTNSTTMWISAITNGGGGGTQVIRIPMALLTVQINSANAYWTAATNGGFIDEAYIIHSDSGKSVSSWWCKVPNNVNSTPAWNIEIDSYPTASSAGILVLSASGLSIATGESANGAGTALVSGGSFTLRHTNILTTSTLSATNFDGTLA